MTTDKLMQGCGCSGCGSMGATFTAPLDDQGLFQVDVHIPKPQLLNLSVAIAGGMLAAEVLKKVFKIK